MRNEKFILKVFILQMHYLRNNHVFKSFKIFEKLFKNYILRINYYP